jgi:polysaccharide export outer membrane protein
VPPPTSTEENTTLGPGDTFMMEIVGEKELPKEYQVASDGTVDVPYLHTVKVAGLEPQEVARMIRQRLMEERILNDPSVVVQVQEYRSKQITVLGQVVKPGAFSFRAGMTLVQAISQAGGLNAIALRDSVRLTRRIANGKTRTVSVDFEAISSGDEDDIVLQAGDRIFVDERVF